MFKNTQIPNFNKIKSYKQVNFNIISLTNITQRNHQQYNPPLKEERDPDCFVFGL